MQDVHRRVSAPHVEWRISTPPRVQANLGRRRSLNNEFQRRLALMENPSDEGTTEVDENEAPPLERQSSLTGEASDLERLAEWQEQALIPLKEDLADWLNNILDVEVNVENFMDVLGNGVHLCHLARKIQTKAQEFIKDNPTAEPFAETKLKCKDSAQTGTWFARDNIANFLQWARDHRVKEECMFETEGLVSHKEARSVVLCLLELARMGARYGMEPPGLVALEKEIEREELQASPTPSSSGRPEITSPTGSDRSGFTSPTGSEKSVKSEPSRPQSAARGRKKSTTKSTEELEKKRAQAKSTDDLDKQVRQITGNCQCPQCYRVDRLSQGRYNIGGKIVFVRLLKGKHVMVRVGGGWDTLQHYLDTHDPCKVIQVKRSTSGNSLIVNNSDEKFLIVHGRYK